MHSHRRRPPERAPSAGRHGAGAYDRSVSRARELADSAVAAVGRVHPLAQDGVLYLLAAAFALGERFVAVTADYREWGAVAAVPYLLAGAVSLLAWRRLGREAGPAAAPRLRHGVMLATTVLVVAVPLALQVTWRADAPVVATNPHSAQAQPEVAVIERAGDRFAHFEDPYLSHPTTVGVSPSNDAHSVNDTSFFPYLPGMVLFGLANASSLPAELGDARCSLAGFTLLVVVLALALAPATSRRRWRAFLFLVTLPTGALPMVTGGDDLPVLALLLLGLVLIQRRRPVLAGVVMGIAGTLKWTAWPLVLLCVLCVRDEDERPAVLRYLASLAAVVVPVVGAGAALGLHAFVENVLSFPLGLTSVRSPAASPLPGQILVQLFPAAKEELTAALVGAGGLVVLAMLVKYPPRDAYQAARFAGLALAFATVIAPATRFGYFIYPVNMLVWAYLLHDRTVRSRRALAAEAPPPPAVPAAGQLLSSTW